MKINLLILLWLAGIGFAHGMEESPKSPDLFGGAPTAIVLSDDGQGRIVPDTHQLCNLAEQQGVTTYYATEVPSIKNKQQAIGCFGLAASCFIGAGINHYLRSEHPTLAPLLMATSVGVGIGVFIDRWFYKVYQIPVITGQSPIPAAQSPLYRQGHGYFRYLFNIYCHGNRYLGPYVVGDNTVEVGSKKGHYINL